MSNNANQHNKSNDSPERFTPDQLVMDKRRQDVLRAAAIVENTARIRGIKFTESQPTQELITINGNVIEAAALFAHRRQVAAEEAAAQQLADEHAARDAIAAAQDPNNLQQQTNVIDASDRFAAAQQVENLENIPEAQRLHQEAARAAVDASYSQEDRKEV